MINPVTFFSLNGFLRSQSPFIHVLTFLMAILPMLIFGQPRRSCGTMDHLHSQISSDPSIEYRMQMIERSTRANAKSAAPFLRGTIKVPVVIHVIYKEGLQNISDAQIRSQLRVLNEDFNRRNKDASNTDPQFRNVAGDVQIGFELANVDPNGSPTSGITRKRTNRVAFYASDNGVKYSAMGGADAWPTDEYLNIWVCNLGMGMLGYAQFPGGPSETDGVVIGYKFFGTTGTAVSPFDKGRTTTHEIGHWLNLRHIWGDGPCGTDDLVDDTPPADRPHHGCMASSISCGSEDMVQNFMDYTDDACMNLFTKGQANRMRALFGPGGVRAKLLRSQALDAPAAPMVLLPPEVLNSSNIESNSARLSWSPVDGAESYRGRFRRLGTDKWNILRFNRTYANANKLRTCTAYEYQIESVIGGKASGFSDSHTFSTVGCSEGPLVSDDNVSPGDVPTGLDASEVRTKDATISWNRVEGASSYKLQYKIAGEKRILSKIVTGTSTKIYGLVGGKRYILRVRANFGGSSVGDYTKVIAFIPGAMTTARMRTARPLDYMRVNYNSRDGWATIAYDIPEEQPVNIFVLDHSGNSVNEYEAFSIERGVPFDLDLGDLTSGQYVIKIEDDQGFSHERMLNIRR